MERRIERQGQGHRWFGSDAGGGDRTVFGCGYSLACVHDHARIGSGKLKSGSDEYSRGKLPNVVVNSSDEMYYGTGKHIPKQLEAARQAARQSRLKANRALNCQKCEPLVSLSN
ncbi:MAG: hypothetical protein H6822_08715 [Planctomycetaceae bacterium]|nr:hypothetical protein [Planctomycetales bacterium]MCB9922250.1 hypothetical protein [Planctomycetaceae bacterium]